MEPNSPAHAVGDEARLLSQATGLPVAVCRYRARALACLTQAHPGVTVVLSDDGLQHPALTRDLELAVFDQRGIGNARLLPAGPLREPISHLPLMDAVVINRGLNPADKPAPNVPQHSNTFDSEIIVRDLIPLANYHTRAPSSGDQVDRELNTVANDCAGDPVAAVAGIANPPAFFALLERAGFTVHEYPLADHGDLDADFLASLSEPLIILTEKDAVKCNSVTDPRIYVLRIAARPAPALVSWLVNQCRVRRQRSDESTQ